MFPTNASIRDRLKYKGEFTRSKKRADQLSEAQDDLARLRDRNTSLLAKMATHELDLKKAGRKAGERYQERIDMKDKFLESAHKVIAQERDMNLGLIAEIEKLKKVFNKELN